MIMIVKYSFLVASLLMAVTGFAQPSLMKLKIGHRPTNNGSVSDYNIVLNTKINNQATIQFAKTARVTQANTPQWLLTQMKFRNNIDQIRFTGKKLKTKDNWHIHHFQQYYRGIRVEYGMASTLSYGGIIKVMQLEFLPVAENLSIMPLISATAAFEKAKDFIAAEKYAWEGYTGSDSTYLLPAAKLTIIENPLHKGQTVLCFKYRISAVKPTKYYEVFVSAMDGKIILSNNLEHSRKASKPGGVGHLSASIDTTATHRTSAAIILFHADKTQHREAIVQASGNTRYSDYKNDIKTDDESNVAGEPYRLQALGYESRHDIKTLNYGGRSFGLSNDALAADFLDNDNDWIEYNDVDSYTHNQTLSGVDVHFNMQVVSDYWANKHGRNGWDDNGSEILNYVNVKFEENDGTIDYDNAAWSPQRKAMYFGDGSFSRTSPLGNLPLTSLDICGHELGHGVSNEHIATADNTGFLYQTESGALDEGFSDIWAACIENYYNEKFDNGIQKKVWEVMEEISQDKIGERNLKNPKKRNCPDTYKGLNWASTEPNPTAPFYDYTNDYGGVHTNSSILTKWFQLVTDGGFGYNDENIGYNIQPMGFDKSEALVYKTEGLLLADADYETTRNVSLAVAESLVGIGIDYPLNLNDVQEIKKAWKAVGLGLDIEVYDMSNQPATFTTNIFQAIAVGKDGHVWAGTNKEGLYKFDGTFWERSVSPVSDYDINDIKADKKGGIWVAQSGAETQLNAGGGIFNFTGTSSGSGIYYGESKGMITRNVQSLFLDTNNTSYINARVWSANFPHILPMPENGTKKGGVCYGVNNAGVFTGIGAQVLDTTRGAECIGGNKDEVWTFANLDTLRADGNQLLRYDAKTTGFIGNYNSLSVPELPLGYIARAIYFDAKGNRWVGLQNGGVRVLDNVGGWHSINFPSAFPVSSAVQKNAIAGDADSVYIGTDSGLVIYNGLGLDAANNYRRLTVSNGLPSNKINGICTDTLRGGLWLATDRGVAFMRLKDSRSINLVSVVYDLCPAPGTFTIDFTTTGNFYNTPVPNKFLVELSDENGSFDDAVLLASVQEAPIGNDEFILNAPIPAGLKNGFKYRLRVRATNPKISGVKNDLNIVAKASPTIPSTLFRANRECVEGDWTHYYFDNGSPNFETFGFRLLSIKKNGNNIGTVDNGNGTLAVTIGTTPTAGTKTATLVTNPSIFRPYYSMNRFWEVIGVTTPITGTVGVRFYFRDEDIYDVNGGYPSNPVFPNELILYKVGGEGCSSDPTANFNNCTRIQSLIPEKPGFIFPTITWKYTNQGFGIHMAEFEVTSFSGGGAGMTVGGGSFTNNYSATVKSGNWSDLTTWSTNAVPNDRTEVIINHIITVDINGICKSLKAKGPGEIKVESEINLTILK